MLLDGAFTALLLLISGVSPVIVRPPTNVTVSCQNLKVTVSWEYSKQQPQTSFRVHMRSSAGDYVNETTDHQYDLSHFVWASEERYMGFHYVTVTAIQGGNQSEPVLSKTFTFNELKPSDIKCKLDFPPVDLNVEDSGGIVSFRNPFHFYRELEQAIKPDDASFTFTVSSDGKDIEGDCTVKQKNCERDISFPEGVEKCVKLKGLLCNRNCVQQMVFRETGSICPSKSTEVHVILLIILLSIIVFIISVVTIIICKTKAWTWIPNPSKSLASQLSNHGEQDLKYYTVSKPDISAVGLTVTKPCKSSSVSSEEENFQDSSAGSDFQSPGLYKEGGLSESSNQLEAVGLMSEGHRTDDDSADDSVKTECVWIDVELEEMLEEFEEEKVEEVSPYDSPQTLQVDMGDGDMVTGYSGR